MTENKHPSEFELYNDRSGNYVWSLCISFQGLHTREREEGQETSTPLLANPLYLLYDNSDAACEYFIKSMAVMGAVVGALAGIVIGGDMLWASAACGLVGGGVGFIAGGLVGATFAGLVNAAWFACTAIKNTIDIVTNAQDSVVKTAQSFANEGKGREHPSGQPPTEPFFPRNTM